MYQNTNAFATGNVPNQAYNMPYWTGMNYGMAQQPQYFTKDWNTPEEIQMMQKSDNQFTFNTTALDQAKAHCPHRFKGQSTLIPDEVNGGYVCTNCGEHMNLTDWTKEQVQQIVDQFMDVMNATKIMYLSLNPEVGISYYDIIPFVKKLPALYEVAANDFKKYNGVDAYVSAPQPNSFVVFNSMMNSGYGYQPQMNMGYQQPQQQMAPGFNPMYGQQMAPNTYAPQNNGFAMNPQGASAPMGTPMYGQQPMNMGFNPNMPVQPVAQQPVQTAPQQPQATAATAPAVQPVNAPAPKAKK